MEKGQGGEKLTFSQWFEYPWVFAPSNGHFWTFKGISVIVIGSELYLFYILQ